jgi:putative ABC transport system permease protein
VATLVQDFRYALRVLGRSKGFTVTAILILALAMGANTAIFSVIEAVLLHPLPYHEPERLCVLWKTVPSRNIAWDWTSYPTIRDWRERSRAFEDLAVMLRPEASQVMLSGERPERVQGSKVSANFFEVLGVAPLLGRTFSRDEDGNNVVLSYGFWQRRFGADKPVIGRPLQLDNQSATIIGVMAPSFQFPDKTAQLWMPLNADSRWPLFQQFRIADAFCALGRLKPGVSIEQARVEMSIISGRLGRQYPATDAGLGVRVTPLFEQIAGSEVRRPLWILAGAVLCVLLIACSNIAGLLVARGAARSRELAVRAALGAGRGRLVWQLAVENILLSLGGAVGGLLLAYAGLHALLALLPASLPRSDGVAMNAPVLAFTFSLCLLTGMVFGLLPAFQITGQYPQINLLAGGRGTSAGLGVNRTRALLVAAQFSFAMVLLVGAGLLIRSFLLLNAVEPGFDTTHLLTMTVELPGARYTDESRILNFSDDAVRRIEALPGVRGAAVGSATFSSFNGNSPNEKIVVEGPSISDDAERHGRDLVSDNFFRVMGIPLRQGRWFSPSDVGNSPPVAVINQSMARRLWPTENAVGKRLKEVLPGLERPWLTVVGVVGNVSLSRDGSVEPMFYRPIRQWSLTPLSLIVRTQGDPLELAAAVKNAVRSVDSAVPYFEVTTVERQLQELDRPRRFQTGLLGAFAASALALAAVGLYGLMSYWVEQRSKEIGIRVALGATSGNVVRLVLRTGLEWVCTGAIIGIVGALALGRALSSLLFGVTATDPVTLMAVIAVLAVVVAAASSIPAFRATKVDPAAALRNE